jgi:hypothetical protein
MILTYKGVGGQIKRKLLCVLTSLRFIVPGISVMELVTVP